MTPIRYAVVVMLATVGLALSACGSGDQVGEPSDESANEPTLSSAVTVPADQIESACGAAASSAVQRTLQQKVAWVVMPGLPPDAIGELDALLASQNRPAGVFINKDLAASDGELLAEIQTRHDVLLAIDEEGGLVQRLEDVAGELPSAAEQAQEPDALYGIVAERVLQLAQAGINVDFAPVVDLRADSSESVIGTRSFGSDPLEVAELAASFADALNDNGVAATLKHFPGHGRASGDSHDDLVTTPPLDDLKTSDLLPYETLAARSSTLVMTGHLDVPGLTEPGQPASLSPATYELLRSEYSFDGVAITDDLVGMKAVSDAFTPAEAAVAAIAAGADIVLYTDSNDFAAVADALELAVESGEITAERLDEAVNRVSGLLCDLQG